MALEQLHAKTLLEFTDLSREGRLTDVQNMPCPAETALGCDRVKGPQSVVFYRHSKSSL
jgi:hypothetical protein